MQVTIKSGIFTQYKTLIPVFGLLVCQQLFAQQDTGQDGARWANIKQALFDNSLIEENPGIISLEAPQRAYDAALVPVKINIDLPDESEHVTRLYLVVDNNPAPLAATFNFKTVQSSIEIQTRLRINEYTHVRAIAETSRNQYFMNTAYVKAAGGCSAPMLSDQEAALARVGKMKFKMADSTREFPDKQIGHLLISHPNNSGMQFDQISRNYIPAYFLNKVTVKLDGKELFELDTNFSLSEDPSIHFSFDVGKNSQGQISVSAVDLDNNHYEKEWPVSANAGS